MDATPSDHRRFFERLCLLREVYARRGPHDDRAVISIADAVRLADPPDSGLHGGRIASSPAH